jgi:hypothetical protein
MRRSWVAALAVVLPVCSSVAASEPPSQPSPTVSAVWVEREFNFFYAGFTAYYSCSGLEGKLEWLLRELGAREGFKVQARGCVNLSGPELMPGARIVVAMPFEATPELLAELAKDDSRRELAARATGDASAVTEATAQFPARVRRVEFVSSRSGRGLQDGDCELMDQAVRQLFPKLGVRVVEGGTRCAPNQVSLGAVRMTVEVLEPVPEAGSPAQ